MTFDAHKNFAKSTVAVAPSPADSGTSLTVASGEGLLFPLLSPPVPFNATVWPADADASITNSEVIRVTAITSDVFTIQRAQEGSVARNIIVGDRIRVTITAKTITDVEQASLAAAAAFYAECQFTDGISVPADVPADIKYSNELFDTHAAYEPTTGVFTVPVTGVYRFTFQLALDNGVSPDIQPETAPNVVLYLYLLKNGVVVNDCYVQSCKFDTFSVDVAEVTPGNPANLAGATTLSLSSNSVIDVGRLDVLVHCAEGDLISIQSWLQSALAASDISFSTGRSFFCGNLVVKG